jgi:hypothetical protein
MGSRRVRNEAFVARTAPCFLRVVGFAAGKIIFSIGFSGPGVLVQTLREREAELRALGVRSVARGDARNDSDVDVLVDLDRE